VVIGRRMRWVGHVAFMGGEKVAKNFSWKPEGKGPRKDGRQEGRKEGRKEAGQKQNERKKIIISEASYSCFSYTHWLVLYQGFTTQSDRHTTAKT
jgi:hypothetical protein